MVVLWEDHVFLDLMKKQKQQIFSTYIGTIFILTSQCIKLEELLMILYLSSLQLYVACL